MTYINEIGRNNAMLDSEKKNASCRLSELVHLL